MDAPTKLQPSKAQTETFALAINLWKKADATLVAEMDDEDGTMLIHVTEDELTTHARIGADGLIIGEWF